jgi:hypothetical protein
MRSGLKYLKLLKERLLWRRWWTFTLHNFLDTSVYAKHHAVK